MRIFSFYSFECQIRNNNFIIEGNCRKDLQSPKAIERQNALAFWLGFDFTLIKSTVLSIDDIGWLDTGP